MSRPGFERDNKWLKRDSRQRRVRHHRLLLAATTTTQAGRASYSVRCFWPHSLHLYSTRVCPGSAETRFGAPHLPHTASIRVLPCLMLTVLRSIASLTRRSASSRIASFDMTGFPGCRRYAPTCEYAHSQCACQKQTVLTTLPRLSFTTYGHFMRSSAVFASSLPSAAACW